LAVFHDDGLQGDNVAGDGLYTAQATLLRNSTGAVYLDASASFKDSSHQQTLTSFPETVLAQTHLAANDAWAAVHGPNIVFRNAAGHTLRDNTEQDFTAQITSQPRINSKDLPIITSPDKSHVGVFSRAAPLAPAVIGQAGIAPVEFSYQDVSGTRWTKTVAKPGRTFFYTGSSTLMSEAGERTLLIEVGEDNEDPVMTIYDASGNALLSEQPGLYALLSAQISSNGRYVLLKGLPATPTQDLIQLAVINVDAPAQRWTASYHGAQVSSEDISENSQGGFDVLLNGHKRYSFPSLLMNGVNPPHTTAAATLLPAQAAAPALLSPQNTPPAASAYSKIPNEWQVTSVYGPRDPGAVGSTFHKGGDYKQNSGNLDKGVILNALETGSIGTIETRGFIANYISIFGAHQISYNHIFDDSTLPITFNNSYLNNSNISAAGYTRVVLDTVKNSKGAQCGAIYFYQMVNGQEVINKVLTTASCANVKITGATAGGATLKAQTTVAANEAIAPMGTSLPSSSDSVDGVTSHVHLQLNGGNNSILTILEHNYGLINGKTTPFDVSLVQSTFTTAVLKAMTQGEGLAIKVSENNLLPILDKVDVSDENGKLLTSFDFGGVEGYAKFQKNITADAQFNTATGNATPLIEPVAWSGSGTARAMTFFVPLKISALPTGSHTVSVTLSTIDGPLPPYALSFQSGDCAIGAKGPAGGIIFYCDSTHQHGLEAAPVDQTASTWGCWGWYSSIKNKYFTYTRVGNTSTAIGTGAANTAAIIAACGSSGGAGNGNPYRYGTASNAAATAAAYTLNGYHDWYLPSLDELNQLHLNQALVGGFASSYYWSSSEYVYYYGAWGQYLVYGYQSNYVKIDALAVRAVRAF